MNARVAIVASLSANGEQGGAERFFVGLRDALVEAGLNAEILEVYNNESNFEQIKKSYLRFYDLDLAHYDGIVSAKAPSFVAQHRNHVCYLMHTIRVFYDMFDSTFTQPTPEVLDQRNLVHALDTAALQRPRRLFAIGEEVAERLQRYNGLRASVMRHPSSLAGLHRGSFDYFFLPGRLHRWKRPHLAIEAMRHVAGARELVIAGAGEDEARFRQLGAGDSRIRFVGHVTDAELADLYAGALAVIFTPQNEDLGLVTLEAFQSGKPVITCTDSGEPARIVKDGQSGFVCRPDAAALARAMECFASDPDRARQMGQAAADSIADLTWAKIGENLREALGFADMAPQ
ncbi:MAG TPA: glycosyltransferase family 4 protein [Rhizomicrobium sp.]|nr:glycosyltransferase family 4 protein [Rhizomicrobium sp.]